MKKYLLGYTISGQTIGVDITSWNTTDLHGNQPFKIILSGTTIPNGYTDISNILAWNQYGNIVANDYLVYKSAIKNIIIEKGWNNLTNTEKDIAIQYYSYPDPTNTVIYLMTNKGMSQQQAQLFLVQQWHIHHGKVLNSCRQRWYYAKLVVPLFIALNDAEDLMNTVENLIFAYTEMGRLGLNYGDKKNGIMDYIESTNAFALQGLKENNYTLLQGTWTDFITALKNVFYEGIYTKYPDFELM